MNKMRAAGKACRRDFGRTLPLETEAKTDYWIIGLLDSWMKRLRFSVYFGRTLPLETEGALCRSVRRVAGRDRRVACATLVRYGSISPSAAVSIQGTPLMFSVKLCRVLKASRTGSCTRNMRGSVVQSVTT